MQLTMYHIPGCPFSERVEVLLHLKELSHLMADVEIDISKPRPDWLLEKTRGTTSLPALELENGATLKESMVIGAPVARCMRCASSGPAPQSRRVDEALLRL
jgi:glutathione S-transferase